jgi:1-acyl-sn-glycerol-3-phosphate acyltransferase
MLWPAHHDCQAVRRMVMTYRTDRRPPDQGPGPQRAAAAATSPRRLARAPLGEAPRLDRFGIRLLGALQVRNGLILQGAAAVAPERDPFILVANHSCRREALLVPAVLMLLRDGRPVRFLADWNFRLIPGVGYVYERGGAITVALKDARPRWLNRFRPRYRRLGSPLQHARAHLAAGGSLGIFPEGTVCRGADRLLPGRMGAAHLSLATGLPVLPLGLRYAGRRESGEIDGGSALTMHFGAPLRPPGGKIVRAALHDWHSRIMLALSDLAGQAWEPSDRHRDDPWPAPRR